MALARWQATITDAAGNAVPGAMVEVRREGGNLVQLFSDREGVAAKGNPFAADADGFAFFHAPGGAYRVRAYSGAFEREWRYVPVGLGAETDLQFARPRGAWDIATAYTFGDFVYHEGSVFIARDASTGSEPDGATPGDTADWMYAGEAVPGPSGVGDRADVMVSISGRPRPGEQVTRIELAFAGTFVEGRSRASGDIASAAEAVFIASLNGMPFATVTFDASDAATVAFTGSGSFAIGDVLTLSAPDPRDAALANISITLAADRGA